jgi:hypothetical protein
MSQSIAATNLSTSILYSQTLRDVQTSISQIVSSQDINENQLVQTQTILQDILELVKTNQTLPPSTKLICFESIKQIAEHVRLSVTSKHILNEAFANLENQLAGPEFGDIIQMIHALKQRM